MARREIIHRPRGGQASIVDDTWTHLDDDAAIPSDGAVSVSWSRRDEVKGRAAPTGLRLPNDVDPDDVAPYFGAVGLLTVDFPTFKDGRGYSLARILREQGGYTGELRAVGYVLRDQLDAMYRCGFDSFALKPGKDVQDALAAFAEFDVTYQPAADEALPLWRRAARG